MRAYVQARVAGSGGAAGKAAEGYASLLALSPGDRELAARALTQAIQAGDRPLALKAARIVARGGDAGVHGRLLFLDDALRTRDWKNAALEIDRIQEDRIFGFMAPILRAWLAVETGKGDPLALLAAAQTDPIGGPYAAEHGPLILLASGKSADGAAALPVIAEGSGARASRLRIAGAALLARRGDRKAALGLLQGDEAPVAAARALLEARQPIPGEIGTAAAGTGELLVRIAVDLNRQNVAPLAIDFARLATFFAPENSETWLVASEMLGSSGRPGEALEALSSIRAGDPFAIQAKDNRIGLLVALGDKDKALAEASAAVKSPAPTFSDWVRLGDLYSDLKRHDEAAPAYGAAIDLAASKGEAARWSLHLLHGGALERAGSWPEARAALQRAYALAPDQAVVLNYLGYAQLERRENVEQAMTLIAEAAKRAPDSAQTTDSLGWAHYLRGNVPKAIELLERAAEAEPADPAISEHLGDAYYSAGRRYEARYAWEAALLAAESDDAARLRAKLVAGLTPKLASP